ncbi:3-oxoacyl-[acyl-carrier-protein] reductase [Anaerococcus sp. AGMB00486]|uniref:3-oxoacyl-[acyl-carrier-protein] reductase n=2 Tax=Anaerococcus TaxID=165779 RepID=A0ABX2N9W3_9FIRM|nr:MULTISPECIES: 3-oxoacyl-[acyl-carrier-protein] reductase [Anaerococcus]MDY3006943.1 3-oxoacyl-[acyl-carrier-protein] reductase [Anaerococcus porci]MSS78326.1 3-oxoacyl-[acyl-carrier-protein] reductase [Anaerococcus porci]NVF11440.1 3-oxoacyl-[acyl-carrier-protein] reductase [Anaerococcus faecalis]
MNNKKYALITGASGGIGSAIARKLASDYNLILHTRSKKDKIDKLKKELDTEVICISADLSNFEDCQKVFNICKEENLDVEVLVNNAGMTLDNVIFRMKEEDFVKVIETNLYSVFYLSKLFARTMMKKKSGRIINIASISGIRGNVGQTNYSASKAGIIGFTKSLAKELATKNILVNAVAPGFIDTEMTNNLNDAVKEEILRDIPLKRYGKAEDVAGLVYFLSGKDSSYITGQVISVDGGMNI